MDETLQQIYNGIIDGNVAVVKENIARALAAKQDPSVILNDAMIAAMSEVGHRFECGEYFVPEMLIAARAMKAGTELLKPHLQNAQVKSVGIVVIGTVKGDLHDIGKNLVGMMLEGAGFQVIDLGTDVAPEKFIDAARSNNANVIGLSALLTTTMPGMKNVIDALEQAKLHQRVKVMVGGAPITDDFARQIGADGFAPDASRAVSVAKSLLG